MEQQMKVVEPPKAEKQTSITGTREQYQVIRRLIHILGGGTIWSIYYFFVTKTQIVTGLGVFLGVVYIIEQVRINYPKQAIHFEVLSKWFLRVEERFDMAGAVPYVISCLLVIIIFPRPVALSAVLILALCDSLGAIVGIAFGKRKLIGKKTWEGTLTILVLATAITFLIFGHLVGFSFKVGVLALIGGLTAAVAEAFPLRIDDNITIPLSCAIMIWLFTLILGI